MRELTLAKEVNEAIAEEMRRDPTIFLMGEDVAEVGTPFKVLSGLVDEFGPERIIDTPISEPGFVGMAVGSAMTGSRPIVDLMFGDFLFLVMDHLCNQAAKAHYMSGGKLKVPMVLRTNLGATRRSAAQHSQSLHALVAHIPGLKVALPSSAYEAKGLMKTAIRDDNPVVIFEDKLMYQEKAPVPEEEYQIPFGQANILRRGRDVTLVATSSMVQVALKAAEILEAEGVSAEVIDPHTIVPLDEDTIVASAQDEARHRHRRGPPELRRDGRDRQPHRREGVLPPRRPGPAHRRHGRARAVLAGPGGSDRADARGGRRAGAPDGARGAVPCRMR